MYNYLTFSVTSVPHRVSHHLSRTCVGFDEFKLDARLGNGTERSSLPVGLRIFLPHNRVEVSIVLVTVHYKPCYFYLVIIYN